MYVIMEETDEKQTESVQTNAVSVFGQTTDDDQLEFCPTKDDRMQEVVINERRLEFFEKELANAKVELEEKDNTYEQALLKIGNQRKTIEELTTLLKRTDSQKGYYINAYQEANARINELESSVDRMARDLLQHQNTHDELTCAKTDLANANDELSILRKATSQVEVMRSALSDEKVKGDELLRQVSDMEEAIARLTNKAAEDEQEKAVALSAKEAELESATKALSEVNEKLKTMHDLEVEKSVYIALLEHELKEANELHGLAQKTASEAVDEVERLKEGVNELEKKNSDRLAYIGLLESEVKELRAGLANSKVDGARMCREAEEAKAELEKSQEKENDAQVEIALLKFELHKGRSKLVAAEATEARSQAEKTALYNALQQMGLEAEETKKENRELKHALHGERNVDVRPGETCGANGHEGGEEAAAAVTVMVEDVRKELEAAMAKIGELRTRAEQAISRAEAAERGKAVMEERMRKRKEHKERRKAAMEALREESITREFGVSDGVGFEGSSSPKYYQPLSKVLNMKF